jgi:hypothetical protein
VVFAPEGLLPEGPDAADVVLVGGARRPTGAPLVSLVFAEVEVALDTPTATAEERLVDLRRHAPWENRGRVRHTGDADGLVRLLTDLSARVDGVRLHPLVLDEDLAVLSRLVTPALRKAGVTATPVPGASLRTTLGLPRPANRYAVPARTGGAR